MYNFKTIWRADTKNTKYSIRYSNNMYPLQHIIDYSNFYKNNNIRLHCIS